MFCIPVIRAFSEPMPLDCELHQCFSVCSLPLGGTERLEGAGVVYSLPQGLDNQFPPRAVLVKKNRVL